jgi:L-ribulokinase
VIVEAFESGGVAVDSVVACGGLPERNKLLMQIYADVLGREITVGASTQAPALGAAMFAAVAAGEYPSIAEASRHMTRRSTDSFAPSAEAHAVYDELYAEYVRLHDLFGRGGDQAMRNLKRLSLGGSE